MISRASAPRSAIAPRSAAAPAQSTSAPVWFRSAQMVSPSMGWAVRWTGNPDVADAARPAAARTTDGGGTWTDVSPPAARPMLTRADSYATLFALDARRAWLAVADVPDIGAWAEQPAPTTVFATADGGRTWTASRPVPGPGIPRAQPGWLYFTDAAHGWLMKDLGAEMGHEAVAIYRSGDGGAHWWLAARTPGIDDRQAGPSGLSVACDKTGITFTGADTGWLTTACNGGRTVALVTHDGGLHWQPQQATACLGGCSEYPPAFSGRDGFLAVDGYGAGAALLVTADGGATWSRAPLPAGAGPLVSAQLVDARHGFLVTAAPPGRAPPVQQKRFLYRTADTGRTWEQLRPAGLPLGQPGLTVSFVTGSAGFAWINGGDAPAGSPASPAYATSDGGKTWRSFTPRMAG